MPLPDYRTMMQNYIEGHYHLKEEILQEKGPDEPCPPTLDVIRGGRLRFRGVLHGERDQVLRALEQCTAGLRADAALLVHDGWMTSVSVNPDTGEQWDPSQNGMDEYVAKHGRNNGVVFEGLNAVLVNREGSVLAAKQMYAVTKSPLGQWKLEWDELEIVEVKAAHNVDTAFGTAFQRGFGKDLVTTEEVLQSIQEQELLGREGAEAVMDAAFVTMVFHKIGPDMSCVLISDTDEPERTTTLEQMLGRRMSSTIAGAYEIAVKSRAARWN